MRKSAESGVRIQRAAAAAALARDLDVGDARPYASISDSVADPAIDALWLTGPNHARIANVEEIVAALAAGRGTLLGIACEKPLALHRRRGRARDVRRQARWSRARLPRESAVRARQIEAGRELLWSRGAASTGRPYLARASEEHGGPHSPWFWRGDLQGGGVLNDMMCHSALLVRHLLTCSAPRARRCVRCA